MSGESPDVLPSWLSENFPIAKRDLRELWRNAPDWVALAARSKYLAFCVAERRWFATTENDATDFYKIETICRQAAEKICSQLGFPSDPRVAVVLNRLVLPGVRVMRALLILREVFTHDPESLRLLSSLPTVKLSDLKALGICPRHIASPLPIDEFKQAILPFYRFSFHERAYLLHQCAMLEYHSSKNSEDVDDFITPDWDSELLRFPSASEACRQLQTFLEEAEKEPADPLDPFLAGDLPWPLPPVENDPDIFAINNANLFREECLIHRRLTDHLPAILVGSEYAYRILSPAKGVLIIHRSHHRWKIAKHFINQSGKIRTEVIHAAQEWIRTKSPCQKDIQGTNELIKIAE